MRERRERGTGRVFLRGGTAWIQYYFHRKQIRVSTGQPDPKKAEKILRRKLGEVEAGIHSDSRSVRYEDLRAAYLLDYEVNDRKSLRRGRDGNPRLDAFTRLDGFFSGFRASEIDADIIRKFISDQQGRGLSNGSINRSVSALRRMFNLAVEDRRLRHVPYFPMLKESAPRQGFFERRQYDALFSALPDYLRLPLALGFFCGMRCGEILALKWEQIDLLSNTIALRAGETKNDSGRTIPIIPQLRVLLLAQRGKRQPQCPYVCFRLDRRGHAVNIVGFRKAWQSACIKAGLGKMERVIDAVTDETVYAKPRAERPRSRPKVKMLYRALIFHDLCRSAVRNLVRSGVPETVARKITGHKTRSVFDRYNITSERDLAEAGRQLAAFHENGDNSGTALHQDAAAGSAVN